MTYYYLHAFKPQYFFPNGFKNHKIFLSLFSPYSIKGKISFFLFLQFSCYRFLFRKKNIEEFIPEKKIRKIITGEPLMAFNTGTVGPEQKITGLGFQKNGKYFFFKYAQTTLSKKNLINEHYILKKIKALDFVPKILFFYKSENNVLLKTDVLTGKRLNNIPVNDLILNCLFELSKQEVKLKNRTDSNLKFVFAHGDFCPWNMMKKNNKILLFDWEMGGNYPLGYDLFTYIFQTNFLLTPNKSILEILLINKTVFEMYFNFFNISDWTDYLIEFFLIKIGIETKKNERNKILYYEKLLNFVKSNMKLILKNN